MACNGRRAVSRRLNDVVVVCSVRAVINGCFLRTFHAANVFTNVFRGVSFAFNERARRFDMYVLDKDHASQDGRVGGKDGRHEARRPYVFVPFYRNERLTIRRFITSAYRYRALSNVARCLKEEGRRGVVVHVSYRDKQVEQFREVPRVPARIRTRVDRVFRSGRVVPDYRFASCLRFLLFRAGPYQVVQVEVSGHYCVTFARRAFRFLARNLSPVVVSVGLFPLRTSGTGLKFLGEGSKVGRRCLIFPQGALHANCRQTR